MCIVQGISWNGQDKFLANGPWKEYKSLYFQMSRRVDFAKIPSVLPPTLYSTYLAHFSGFYDSWCVGLLLYASRVLDQIERSIYGYIEFMIGGMQMGGSDRNWEAMEDRPVKEALRERKIFPRTAPYLSPPSSLTSHDAPVRRPERALKLEEGVTSVY